MKILKFQAEWCGPCKSLSTTINGIKDQLPLQIEEVDIDQNSDLAIKYNIRGVPTLVIVDNDTEVKRHTGNMTAEQVKKFATL